MGIYISTFQLDTPDPATIAFSFNSYFYPAIDFFMFGNKRKSIGLGNLSILKWVVNPIVRHSSSKV